MRHPRSLKRALGHSPESLPRRAPALSPSSSGGPAPQPGAGTPDGSGPESARSAATAATAAGAAAAGQVLLVASGVTGAAGAGFQLVGSPAASPFLLLAATLAAVGTTVQGVAGRSRRWRPGRAAVRVLAALVAVIVSPVLVVIGLAVRLTSRGPALVRQLQPGRDGRAVPVLRFRTTVSPGGSAPDDPVTPVGRVLQRLSLDELPRLLEVARGNLPVRAQVASGRSTVRRAG